MRTRLLAVVFLLTCLSFATELKIKVVDPQSAVVPRARVAVSGVAQFHDVRFTATDGSTTFDVQPGTYRVQVLVPGFAAEQVQTSVPRGDELTVRLRLAATPETVEVSATRTPISVEESSAAVEVLGSNQLLAMQPVAISEALRFVPGVLINASGRRGGQASMFVRGGDSRYNKVIIDDVPVNDPGGTIDLGVIPTDEVGRVEVVRGAESALYGSDAMTSTVQIFTRTGTTRTPELRLGADGGTFSTARGYASLSGARGRFDYNLFGQQFNTGGQGINDEYSNASQGANIGVRITDSSAFRLRVRHSNSYTGVPSSWNYNGQALMTPDADAHAHQNNFLASGEFTFATPGNWHHRVTGFEYNHRRNNVDLVTDPGRVSPVFGNIDTFHYSDYFNVNRAGVDYQGDWLARSWARTTVGYHFENENGFFGDLLQANAPTFPTPLRHGLRRNHDVFGQELITWKRFSFVGGLRFAHNETFGNEVIPHIAASVLAFRGNNVLSGTRFRFVYGEGIKAPRFEESFANDAFTRPNPNLKAEENRSFEAGVQQGFFSNKVFASATYFNNSFRNQIDYTTIDFNTFVGQYVNIAKSMAHGAELTLNAQPMSKLRIDAAYIYTSTQILDNPLCLVFCDTTKQPGAQLLRRPKHFGSVLATWTSGNWGANVGGSFVGRRPDSDFGLFLTPITYAAGYARIDLGAWRAVTPRVTIYTNIDNALNRHYEEVAGYPALRFNIRAGMRFRLGGE